mmetsp:Transcript_47223/g.90140  ORF Transcript_47223/g.90140 Transcript_47223/m.90140 type:complete len:385 (+) Transcript_47223:1011-2165(+)
MRDAYGRRSAYAAVGVRLVHHEVVVLVLLVKPRSHPSHRVPAVLQLAERGKRLAARSAQPHPGSAPVPKSRGGAGRVLGGAQAAIGARGGARHSGGEGGARGLRSGGRHGCVVGRAGGIGPAQRAALSRRRRAARGIRRRPRGARRKRLWTGRLAELLDAEVRLRLGAGTGRPLQGERAHHRGRCRRHQVLPRVVVVAGVAGVAGVADSILRMLSNRRAGAASRRRAASRVGSAESPLPPRGAAGLQERLPRARPAGRGARRSCKLAVGNRRLSTPFASKAATEMRTFALTQLGLCYAMPVPMLVLPQVTTHSPGYSILRCCSSRGHSQSTGHGRGVEGPILPIGRRHTSPPEFMDGLNISASQQSYISRLEISGRLRLSHPHP